MSRVKVIKVPGTPVLPPGNITPGEWLPVKDGANLSAEFVPVLTARRYDIESFGARRGRGMSAAQRTANTAAINAAATAARGGEEPYHDSSLGTVVMKGEYEVDPGIALCCNVDALGATLFVYGAESGDPSVLVGSKTERVNDLTIYMPKVRKFPSGWNGATGVEFAGISSSTIFTNNTSYFERNILFSANAASPANVSNRVYLGRLTDGKVQLELAPADTTGWVNENTFFTGHFQIAASYGTKVSGCSGIKLSSPAGGNSVNNNAFYHPNLEGVAYEYHVNMDNAYYNDFFNTRWERPDGALAQVRCKDSRDNSFWSGYQPFKVDIINSGTSSNNQVMSLASIVHAGQASMYPFGAVGTLVGRYRVTDSKGNLLGYVPIYDAIT